MVAQEDDQGRTIEVVKLASGKQVSHPPSIDGHDLLVHVADLLIRAALRG